jgi:hypothetical protein
MKLAVTLETPKVLTYLRQEKAQPYGGMLRAI